jgi:hypothetical protein
VWECVSYARWLQKFREVPPPLGPPPSRMWSWSLRPPSLKCVLFFVALPLSPTRCPAISPPQGFVSFLSFTRAILALQIPADLMSPSLSCLLGPSSSLRALSRPLEPYLSLATLPHHRRGGEDPLHSLTRAVSAPCIPSSPYPSPSSPLGPFSPRDYHG